MARHPHLSMFARRLLMLGITAVAVFGILTIHLLRLSVAKSAEHRRNANAQLRHTTYLPTVRGDIVDRYGRLLATDIASYDVAIAYELITGSWIDRRAMADAIRAVGRQSWEQMSPEQRDEAMRQREPEHRATAEEIWAAVMRHGHLTVEELTEIRDGIKAEVQMLRAEVWSAQRQRWNQEQANLDERLLLRLGEERPRFKPRAIREERSHHVILARVNDETVFAFRRLEQQHPRLVRVIDSTRRHNPWDERNVVLDRSRLPQPLRSDVPATVYVEGIGDHIIGSLRDGATLQDIRRRPFVSGGGVDLGGYRATGDRVGASGIERVQERRLRGERGRIVEHLDTNELVRQPPTPGGPVRLTIDIELQAQVQAILSHRFGLTVLQPWHESSALPLAWPLNSAAVVVDVASGEILAAVSMPTKAMARHMDEYRSKLDLPHLFRPTDAMYPPGSIIKPLILCIAVEQGVHDPATTIECTGHYYPNVTTRARCWIYRQQYEYRTHGPLAADEALARSCNIFFYTLADRVGMEGLVGWLRRFGLGSPLEVGLTHVWVEQDAEGNEIEKRRGELGGMLPSPGRRSWSRAPIPIGIGQQLLTWTPVQAANAYATLARHGVVRDATLMADPAPERAPRPDFRLPDRLVDLALAGLRQSVEEAHGTSHHIRHPDETREPIFNAPGVTVWGKTGTAEAPLFALDTDGDGVIREDDRGNRVEGVTGLDHSWFVGLVGPEGGDPRVAVAVIVEFGGSGGRVAGPIANQIILALQRTGYLSGGAGPRPE